MPRRKIRDVEDARACLASVAASGLTRSDWAVKNGVDGRSLQAWRVTLERSAKRQPPVVEVVLAEPKLSATYLVHCGRMAVEVDGRFDEDVLRRLLALVASC